VIAVVAANPREVPMPVSCFPTIFVLSIEPVEGTAFEYGFGLGTDPRVAREIAAEKFRARNASPYPRDLDGHVMATRTVALKWDGKIVDVFDGEWESERDWPDFEAAEHAAPADDYAWVEEA
jgi:hypothetical protein